MEELLCKVVPFVWIEGYEIRFAKLKHRMVTTLILVFQNWSKIFHVHVDASGVTLINDLAQLREEGKLDHQIYSVSRKFTC
jgi:hypothetical protein